MTTEARRAANRRWYWKNRAAAIMATKARAAGLRVTLAECRAVVADRIPKVYSPRTGKTGRHDYEGKENGKGKEKARGGKSGASSGSGNGARPEIRHR